MKDLLSNLHVLSEAATRCRRLLIGCDFDSTLARISDTPETAVLPDSLATALCNLSQTPGIQAAVVSGRSLTDLVERVPFRVILVGNHGLEIRGPDWTFEHRHATAMRPVLNESCERIAEILPSFPGALLESKRLTATVHYRLVAEHLHAPLLRRLRSLMAEYSPRLSLRAGRLATEIHPRLPWNKGSALALIRIRTGLEYAPCICIGDDRTDEWMFKRFEDGISVIVGDRTNTTARFRLHDPEEVATVLNYIADTFAEPVAYRRDTQQVFAPEAAWVVGA